MTAEQMAQKIIGFLLLVNLTGLVLSILKNSHVLAFVLIATTMWLWAMYIADAVKQ
jgi:hypothetical protein